MSFYFKPGNYAPRTLNPSEVLCVAVAFLNFIHVMTDKL